MQFAKAVLQHQSVGQRSRTQRDGTHAVAAVQKTQPAYSCLANLALVVVINQESIHAFASIEFSLVRREGRRWARNTHNVDLTSIYFPLDVPAPHEVMST